jgi:hypothetical protein
MSLPPGWPGFLALSPTITGAFSPCGCRTLGRIVQSFLPVEIKTQNCIAEFALFGGSDMMQLRGYGGNQLPGDLL